MRKSAHQERRRKRTATRVFAVPLAFGAVPAWHVYRGRQKCRAPPGLHTRRGVTLAAASQTGRPEPAPGEPAPRKATEG
ncbi:uncharacterized protein LOC126418732 isoform X3 [Schistocerca serialis cubense]|uniref:uncharacterized protein LOC126418732 isoform X3 n=1 Tax=Schistocerca serialis cubense TaxID=2023355 RepID=UPI00214E19DF|nr:uncharacterized protein LOC126418732 isoform X3 [Schistocerca serialis cubense]